MARLLLMASGAGVVFGAWRPVVVTSSSVSLMATSLALSPASAWKLRYAVGAVLSLLEPSSSMVTTLISRLPSVGTRRWPRMAGSYLRSDAFMVTVLPAWSVSTSVCVFWNDSLAASMLACWASRDARSLLRSSTKFILSGWSRSRLSSPAGRNFGSSLSAFGIVSGGSSPCSRCIAASVPSATRPSQRMMTTVEVSRAAGAPPILAAAGRMELVFWGCVVAALFSSSMSVCGFAR